MSGWYCEEHPDQIMGHNGCEGAGIPECACVSVALNQARLAKQAEREAHVFYADVVAQARQALQSSREDAERLANCLRDAIADIEWLDGKDNSCNETGDLTPYREALAAHDKANS